MTRIRGALVCGFILWTLLACKVVDKLKQQVKGDEGVQESSGATPATSSSAAAPAHSSSDKVVTMNGKFSPLPFRVGQMVRYQGKEENSGFTYSVVGKEQGAWKLEAVVPTRAGDTVTQILMKVNDARDPDSLKLLSAKVKAPGMPAMSFGGEQADMLGKISQGIVQGVKIPDYDGAPREDVVVPAGRFQGAMRVKQKEKIMGFESSTTSWHHSSVPVTTMVKMEGTFQGKPTSLELVEYSLTGAESKL